MDRSDFQQFLDRGVPGWFVNAARVFFHAHVFCTMQRFVPEFLNGVSYNRCRFCIVLADFD